ncbi:MAG TPA: MFS transporter [Microlunatus sp.]
MSPSVPAANAPVTARLRRARFGVFGIFFVVGLGMAAWLVSIPAVQQRTGVSHATLGLLLLVLGAGGVIGMQIAGYAIARWGSKVITAAALALYVLAVNLPVHSTDTLTLGAALLVFGLANGAVDVSMNDQAVIVERGYGRPIMSAFHAFWSVGGAVGALIGAAALGLGYQVSVAVLIASAAAAIGGVVCGRLLAPREPVPTSASVDDPGAAAVASAADGRSIRRRVIGFGVLAFLLMLAEGVANDWSALHAVEHLDQPPSAAALAYATFAVAMTVGRLTVDRIAGRFGPAYVVRYGSLAAAVGIGVVMISPALPLTLVGWAVFGLGLAGVVPQLFTAAGNIGSTNQSIILSRVVGAGYVGQLAGPALVGVVAGWVGLNLAFALPLIVCVVAVVVAPIVSRPPQAVEETAEQPVELSYDADRA